MRRSLLPKGLYWLCVVFWLFVAVSSTSRPAYAYVDPGTGLFLLQMVGSTFAGMMFLLRKRVRQFLGRFFSRFAEAKGDSVER
jgi:hypothetical protein